MEERVFIDWISEDTILREQKRKDGADISEYSPEGDWRNYDQT